MSEETVAPQADPSVSKTLLVGCSLILWILGIYMIFTLNKIKEELSKLNACTSELLNRTNTTLTAYQVKDAAGNVVYEFATKPVQMEEDASCSGEGAACPATKQ